MHARPGLLRVAGWHPEQPRQSAMIASVDQYSKPRSLSAAPQLTRHHAALGEQEVGQLADAAGGGGAHTGADGLQVGITQANHCRRGVAGGGVQAGGCRWASSEWISWEQGVQQAHVCAVTQPQQAPTHPPDSMPCGLPSLAAADMLSARTLTTCSVGEGGGGAAPQGQAGADKHAASQTAAPARAATVVAALTDSFAVNHGSKAGSP